MVVFFWNKSSVTKRSKNENSCYGNWTRNLTVANPTLYHCANGGQIFTKSLKINIFRDFLFSTSYNQFLTRFLFVSSLVRFESATACRLGPCNWSSTLATHRQTHTNRFRILLVILDLIFFLFFFYFFFFFFFFFFVFFLLIFFATKWCFWRFSLQYIIQ